MARATTQFILFTIIAANVGRGESHTMGVTILFFAGAVWTAALSLALRPLFRTLLPAPPSHQVPKPPKYPIGQYLRRWRGTLTHLAGWQYTLRMTACLAAAETLDWLWPGHHGYWVAITAVIVVQRNVQAALPRTIHRAAGTTLGVLLISLFMLWESPMWAVIALIAALAAVRPILIEANYLAYAVIQTPLVILLLEFGQDSSWALVIDRLAATLAGCTLTLTLGYLGWSGITPRERAPAVQNVL